MGFLQHTHQQVYRVVKMKKLSFGLMRLPLKSEDKNDVDYEKTSKMVDYAMERGFNFFDSGYEYHDGNSDVAIKKCIADKYPREDFIISNKLPVYDFDENTNMEKVFNEQLEKCGVDYFDYYVLHCLTDEIYEGVVKTLDSFNFIKNLKEKGLIRKMGISIHDNAKVLEKILIENPEIEFVILQINYLDWTNPSIQSGKCYKIAKRYNKEIIVMEPLKGGTLIDIPDDARKLLEKQNPDLSMAAWGLGFAASLEGVSTVLCGMSNIEQMIENINYMDDFKPLNSKEKRVLRMARKSIANSIPIQCTYCDYCLDVCEENIPISNFLAILNDAKTSIEIQDLHRIYYTNNAKIGAPASQCTKCGECEAICTQHLKIMDYLDEIEDVLGIDENSY